jgi:hypothetical protein
MILKRWRRWRLNRAAKAYADLFAVMEIGRGLTRTEARIVRRDFAKGKLTDQTFELIERARRESK